MPSKIVKKFVVNHKEQVIELTLSGDYSHYHNADNPIIEFFRAINLSLMRRAQHNPSYAPMMHYVVGFPKYNAETSETTCIFRPNYVTYIPKTASSPQDQAKEISTIMTKNSEKIKKEFAHIIEDFTNDPNGYALYGQYIATAASAPNADLRSEAIENANQVLKSTLIKNGYIPAHGFRVQYS